MYYLSMNIELLKTFTILYVEDENALREEVYQNISQFVKKMINAIDGAECLELYKQNRNELDIIITDILMPNMTGLEMVDEIRKVDSEIPIIYTTAFNDSDYMKKTIEQSIVSYIVKPIDVELLLKGIEKASLKIENERLKATLLGINEELEVKINDKTKKLRETNKILKNQLYTDELTSLANRKLLIEDIDKFKNPILSIIDLDAFGTINDLYGEKIGNKVLINVASLIDEFSKSIDCKAYRIGGDIFAILKDKEFHSQECILNIESLIQKVAEYPICLDEYDITVRMSITVGISKEHTDTLEKASMALMRAKKNRTSYILYNDEHNLDEEFQNDIKWTKIIKNAIDNDGVVAYYQPILNKEQKIIKHECLIRISEDDVIHSPYLFLDISKKVKLYPQLAKMIILKAFKKAKESSSSITVNLSIQDIVNKDIVKMIVDELQKNSIANLITFEILESESITDYEKVISFISIVKKLGCKIAIDDFGSGYSNFSYLLRLKPDYIKIDGSLVKNIHLDENSYLITKTINDFAHSLGMKTIAEFVHCEDVLRLLEEIGVDEYQGFYFSEPLAHI